MIFYCVELDEIILWCGLQDFGFARQHIWATERLNETMPAGMMDQLLVKHDWAFVGYL